MSNFYDKDHTVGELVFQGARELDIEASCSELILNSLSKWQARSNQSDAKPELFQLEKTRSFIISYDGITGQYWPDEASNLIGESLIRDFLFPDGICRLDTLDVRLYIVSYKIIAMLDLEYLLVCPFATDAGNIAGLSVVCINHHIRPDATPYQG